jgi:dynein light intermediate chain|tara:strand:+ start:359 stop:664 length:306 start_codon:yes stop_codon:yes gene_type:complete
MTIAAYETLYESSIAYGIRKALMAEQKRSDLNAENMQLAVIRKDLQKEVDALKQQIVESQAKAQERRDAEEKLHNDDVERIQRTNDQLKVSLENLLAAPKK